MMRMRATLVSVAAAMLILGCGGDDATGPPPQPQPQPGELRVTMTGGSVGGVVFTVTGTGMTAPVVSGAVVMYYDLSGETLHAVVTASSLSGEILRFTVPDVRQVAGYQVTVEQAAGTSNQSVAASAVTLAVVE